MTAHNAFVRINVNRSLAGESIVMDAPSYGGSIPSVSYTTVVLTPQMIMFSGIRHESAPYKLVVKMSASQSAGISNGWSKTILLASDIEDDWGEADVTRLYLKAIGVEPVPGQKVFIETYWMNTQTGIGGQVFKNSYGRVHLSAADACHYGQFESKGRTARFCNRCRLLYRSKCHQLRCCMPWTQQRGII